MSAQVPTSKYIGAISHLPVGSTLTIPDVSWEEYEELLEELDERFAVRVTYNNGRLEIVSPSYRHEKYKELISDIARAVANQFGLKLEKSGSTTFKQTKFAQGAEPDLSFYVQNAAIVCSKDIIDLNVDPPPDVVVEIDVTRETPNKLDIYAGIGVPELWRYDGQRVRIYLLLSGHYTEMETSAAFPVLTSEILTRFLDQCKSEGQSSTLSAFQQWLSSQREQKG
ncbi:MAG TPA: Uma2 family endonuclease [Blastocatellia bacterium]|nr:Uma2 family endonuclease [Blastocatellia bacterium]